MGGEPTAKTLSCSDFQKENIICQMCCGKMAMPRTFTALAAAEVKGHRHQHHHHHHHYHHNSYHRHCHDDQVGGESVLMVVGGDNLADNQESSLEIYNRLLVVIIMIKIMIMVMMEIYNRFNFVIISVCHDHHDCDHGHGHDGGLQKVQLHHHLCLS